MVPRKKISKKRPADSSKVVQLEARTRQAAARTRAAKERARLAKQQAKEARKLFKQAKKVAKRARDELHALSSKLKGLLGSVADRASEAVKSVRPGKRKNKARKKPVTKPATTKPATAAKKRKSPGKRNSVTRGTALPPKAAVSKKRAAGKPGKAPAPKTPAAVPAKRRRVSAARKKSPQVNSVAAADETSVLPASGESTE